MAEKSMPRQIAVEEDGDLEDGSYDDVPVCGFHNPLFAARTPIDKSLYPAATVASAADDHDNDGKRSSSMVMRRHQRQDGTLMDATRQSMPDRSHKAVGDRQLQKVSSMHVPACVVVKSGDASAADEILQHCAFHVEAFRVRTKAQAAATPQTPKSTSFFFVFNGGQPNQAALEITHMRQPASAGKGRHEEGGPPDLPPASPTDSDGGVTMTLGGKIVPHLPGEPYSCKIRQVGDVIFNPRKQACGNYLYILSHEGRTLFTALC